MCVCANASVSVCPAVAWHVSPAFRFRGRCRRPQASNERFPPSHSTRGVLSARTDEVTSVSVARAWQPRRGTCAARYGGIFVGIWPGSVGFERIFNLGTHKGTTENRGNTERAARLFSFLGRFRTQTKRFVLDRAEFLAVSGTHRKRQSVAGARPSEGARWRGVITTRNTTRNHPRSHVRSGKPHPPGIEPARPPTPPTSSDGCARTPHSSRL